MLLIDSNLCWSASDLTAAATCEYALLRTLDYTLRWVDPIQAEVDPLMERIATLGDQHEAQLLADLRANRRVAVLPRAEQPLTASTLEGARDATAKAFASDVDVVYQAAFFDGEFFGYADFVERTEDGWLVSDAKLARHAKPQALLQLGAYAEQIRKLGLPLSSTISLLLGNGERADFQVADVLPVFGERRERLRFLLTDHRSEGMAVAWGDEGLVACGSCPECRHAAEFSSDVILVAGLRMEQRRKLRGAGVTTVAELADAAKKPEQMTRATFDKLRAQASMQWKQMQGGADAPIEYELTASAAKTLSLLPAPSEGDLFFDFEGDPLYDEGDPSRIGLEYLWGILDEREQYLPLWAHNSSEERAAFAAFIDLVAERREQFPDLHVYHYAPYETSALKRLAMRFQAKEKELDDLLRSEVFVDLYATVRGSIRVSAPSYSIKKLEPLYMGDQLRSDEDEAVADGGASVVAYHEFRAMQVDYPAAAEVRLEALADYNEYDCLSTLRLRDWLLERADEIGVGGFVPSLTELGEGGEVCEPDPLFTQLMEKSGPELRVGRTREEQAYAMLATSLDYYRRESKQYWWDHFDRLLHSIEEWSDTRDIFVVESAEVVEHWAVPGGRARNSRRVVRLLGDWTPGSKPSSQSQVVYTTPAPNKSFGPDRAPYGAAEAHNVVADPDGSRAVLLTESRAPIDIFA